MNADSEGGWICKREGLSELSDVNSLENPHWSPDSMPQGQLSCQSSNTELSLLTLLSTSKLVDVTSGHKIFYSNCITEFRIVTCDYNSDMCWSCILH